MHSQSVQYTLWKHKMARTTKSIQHPVPGSAYYDPKYIHCKIISAKQDWFVCKEVGQAQQMHLVPKQGKDSTAAPLIICRVRHLRPDRCWRIEGGIFHPLDLMDSDALASDGSNAIWRDWLGPLTDGLVAGLWTPFYQTPAFIWAPCPALLRIFNARKQFILRNWPFRRRSGCTEKVISG